MMTKGKGIHMVTFLLMVIGGLNWLLVGIFSWEISILVGGPASIIGRAIFIIVGLATIYELATHGKNCKECIKKDKSNSIPTPPPTSMPPSAGGI